MEIVANTCGEETTTVKIKDILSTKANPIVTIGPDASVLDAIRVLCDHKIGSLLVLDTETGAPIGIITERDILWEVCDNHDHLTEHKVRDVMTSDLIVAVPDDDVEYASQVMTNNRIRHLPVVKESAVVGLISIGDVVKCLLQNTQVENRWLRDYIQQSG